MIKKILMGMLAVVMASMFSGCTMTKMGVTFMGFEPETQEAYAAMMDVVAESGDPAKAMMLEFKVADDVTEDDVFETMRELALEYNMRVVGEKNMFRIKDGKSDEIVHARILEVCSLSVAKQFLNHSRYFGGFMPCRIMFVEYGNGDRFLITMDLTLAIYGGDPLPKNMLELALGVQEAMGEISKQAASGE